jgi:ankyrin repeat protein
MLIKLIIDNEIDKLVEYLSRPGYVDVNVCDKNGMFLISYAVMNNNERIVRMLLKKDVQLDVIDSDGMSLLHVPIMLCYTNMFTLLLDFATTSRGVPLYNIIDKYNTPPLFYAIRYKNTNMFSTLLQCRNISIYHQNNSGNTCLHKICRMPSVAAVRFLDIFFAKKYPTDELCRLLQIRNRMGDTCLHLLLTNNIMYSFTYFSCILDIPNNSMLTPLMVSLSQPIVNRMFVNKLLSMVSPANKYINTSDYSGTTPLHVAAKKKMFDIFNDLLSLRPKINLFDVHGNTACHILFREATVDQLISITNMAYIGEHIDWNSTNTSQYTPLYYIAIDPEKQKWFLKNHQLWLTTIFSQMNEFDFLSDRRLSSRIDSTQIATYPDEKSLLRLFLSAKQLNSMETWSSGDHYVWTGSWIDILFGYLMMRETSDRIKTPLDYMTFEELFENESRTKFFKTYQLQTRSVNPINQDLFIYESKLSPFEFSPEQLSTLRSDWKSKKYDFCCILTIFNSNESHANLIICDSSKGEVVRFEPNGSIADVNRNTQTLVEEYFTELLNASDITFVKPQQRTQNIGLQTLETNELDNKHITDPSGFCGAWSLFYVLVRYNKIINSGTSLLKHLRVSNLSMKKFIREVGNLILWRRDKFLNSIDSSIDKLLYLDTEMHRPEFRDVLKTHLGYGTPTVKTTKPKKK